MTMVLIAGLLPVAVLLFYIYDDGVKTPVF